MQDTRANPALTWCPTRVVVLAANSKAKEAKEKARAKTRTEKRIRKDPCLKVMASSKGPKLEKQSAQTITHLAVVPEASLAVGSVNVTKAFTFAGRQIASTGLPTGTLRTLITMSERRRLLQICYLRRRGLQQKPLAPAVFHPRLPNLGQTRMIATGGFREKNVQTSFQT